jgi:hypothetical protein
MLPDGEKWPEPGEHRTVTISPYTWDMVRDVINERTVTSLNTESLTTLLETKGILHPDRSNIGPLEALACIEELQSQGKIAKEADDRTGMFKVNHSPLTPHGHAKHVDTRGYGKSERPRGRRTAEFIEKNIGRPVPFFQVTFGGLKRMVPGHGKGGAEAAGARAEAAAVNSEENRAKEARFNRNRRTKLALKYTQSEIAGRGTFSAAMEERKMMQAMRSGYTGDAAEPQPIIPTLGVELPPEVTHTDRANMETLFGSVLSGEAEIRRRRSMDPWEVALQYIAGEKGAKEDENDSRGKAKEPKARTSFTVDQFNSFMVKELGDEKALARSRGANFDDLRSDAKNAYTRVAKQLRATQDAHIVLGLINQGIVEADPSDETRFIVRKDRDAINSIREAYVREREAAKAKAAAEAAAHPEAAEEPQPRRAAPEEVAIDTAGRAADTDEGGEGVDVNAAPVAEEDEEN